MPTPCEAHNSIAVLFPGGSNISVNELVKVEVDGICSDNQSCVAGVILDVIHTLGASTFNWSIWEKLAPVSPNVKITGGSYTGAAGEELLLNRFHNIDTPGCGQTVARLYEFYNVDHTTYPTNGPLDPSFIGALWIQNYCSPCV